MIGIDLRAHDDTSRLAILARCDGCHERASELREVEVLIAPRLAPQIRLCAGCRERARIGGCDGDLVAFMYVCDPLDA